MIAVLRPLFRGLHGALKSRQDRLTRSRRDHPERQVEQILAVARHGGIPGGARLDVGGGEGRLRPLFDDGRGRVVEIDVAPTSRPDVRADVHDLPVASGAAGLVALVEVLEHLVEPHRAVAECYRVLCPGGFMIITTPQYWHVHAHPSDYHRFTDLGLRRLCERAGFTLVDCWSRGGPALVVFHVIRLNISDRWRPLFVLAAYRLAQWLDARTYDPRPRGTHYDALGWSVLAQKPAGAREAA